MDAYKRAIFAFKFVKHFYRPSHTSYDHGKSYTVLEIQFWSVNVRLYDKQKFRAFPSSDASDYNE